MHDLKQVFPPHAVPKLYNSGSGVGGWSGYSNGQAAGGVE